MRAVALAMLLLVAAAATTRAQVSGQVTDSTTGKGIDQADVRVAGANIAATTSSDGRYQLTGVGPGRQTLLVRRVGYRGARRIVTVTGGGPITVDFQLAPTISTLEEITVAGSVTEAKKKESPVPITVINEAQIQTPSRNQIEQLFRGDVPGVVGFDLGGQAVSTFAFIRGRATLDLYNLIKVYIDDIEVPSIDLISSIDLKNIERIELLRGPQASTIYGANASGGVLLLFTKKGSQGNPKLSGSAAAGFIDSKYVSNPGTTENKLNVAGGGPGFSYSLGGSYQANGDVTPEVDQWKYGVTGRTQITQGKIGLGVTGAVSRQVLGTGNLPDFDAFFQQLYDLLTPPVAQQFGVPKPGARQFRNQVIGNQTVGATLSYAPVRNWQNRLTLGWDRLHYETDQYAPTRQSPSDTFRLQYLEGHDVFSFRYNTTGNLTLSPAAALTLTGGLDISRRTTATASSSRVVDPAGDAAGFLGVPKVSTSRGIYGQGVLGIKERLFLTGAVRLEHFTSVGATLNDDNIVAPRFGAAYNIPLTNAVLKPRIAYGKGVRPPTVAQIAAHIGAVLKQIANPTLRPEVSTGFDGGFDLDIHQGKYVFEATYFNQKAKDLITTAQSVIAQPFTINQQWINAATIRNKGVELAATANLRQLTLRGQFTAIKSRVLEINRPTTGSLSLNVEPGDRPPYTAEKSGGGSAILRFGPAFAKSSGIDGAVELGLTYIGERTSIDQVNLLGCQVTGAPPFCGTVNPATATERDFRVTLPAVTKLRAAVSHPLAREIEGFLNVENVFNNQDPEMQTIYPSRGRVVLFGVRFGR